MRNILLSVLTTVTLVLVAVGPAAALQEASQLSTGYLTIGRVTSSADIGPRRQQDRGSGVGALAGGVKNQRPDGIGSCEGDFDLNCYRRFDCHESADVALSAYLRSKGLLTPAHPDPDSFTEAMRVRYANLFRNWEASMASCDLNYPYPTGPVVR